MIVHYYALYDTVAKECVRLLQSKDDRTMERSVEYIVRDPKFDKISGKDLVVNHVFDFDTETGKIVNNDVRLVCAVASCMARFETEQLLEAKVELERKVANEDGKSITSEPTKTEKN